MELSEMLSTKPSDYLKNGFFDADGEFYEGINGEHSLGMAYRLREEGIGPDRLEKIVNQLESIMDSQDESIDENPEQPLDVKSVGLQERLAQNPDVAGSSALKEIFAAAGPSIRTWKGLAALAVHLRRIMSQLALLTNLPPREE